MKPKSRHLRSLAIATSALLCISYAHAQSTLIWDANGATALQTDGLGAWLGANQWWTGAANTTWTSGDSAIFGNGGAGGAVGLASATTAGSLTFNRFTGTYTLGTAANILTINNGITMNAASGAVTLASPIKLGAAQTWTNNTNNVLSVIDSTNNSVIDLNGFALTFKGGGPSQGKFNVLRGNGITGSGGVIVDNAYLDLRTGGAQSTNNYSGTTTLQNGAGMLQNGGNFSANSNIILNGGVIDGYFNSGFTRALGTGVTQVQITGGASGFGTNGSATVNLGGAGAQVVWGSTFFNPSSLVLGTAGSSAGTTTFANAIGLGGTTRTIAVNSPTGVAANGAISGIISTTGTAGIIKTGIGTLSLTAANTYNGATTINAGNLTLSGSGTLANTSALNLSGGGILQLTNTAQLNRFNDVAVSSNGGGITYANTNTAAITYTESFGAVALNGGNLDVLLNTNQSTSNGQTLTFGTGGTTNMVQSGTATVAFSANTTGPQASGNKNMIVVTGSGTTTAGQIIGAWATTGTAAAAQTDYAIYTSNFVVPAAIAATAESTWTVSTDTYTAGLTGLAGTTLGATRNITALKLNATTAGLAGVTFAGAAAADFITVTGSTFANGDVVSFGGTAPGGLATGIPYYVVNAGTNGAGTFTVSGTSGGAPIDLTSAGTSPNVVAGITLATGRNLGTTGILNSTAAGLTIGKGTGGVVTLPSTTSANLYMNTGNTAAIIVGAPIADNGAGVLTLVKTGTASLRLIDVNTYTGNTAINAGTLQIGINGQALANGAKLGGASGNYAGNIFIGAGATLDVQTNVDQTLSGAISGDGNIVKRNSGALTLSGSNTFTGKFSVTPLTTAGSGAVSVSSFNSVVGGSASSSLGAPTTVANGTIDLGSGSVQAGVTLRYTGTGETTDRVLNFIYNNSGVSHTLETNGASGLLKFSSAFTSNGIAGNVIFQGSGNGELAQGLPFALTNFTKAGTGTWTLGGPSGQTGTTSISAGTLIGTHHQAFGNNLSGITIAAVGTLSLRNDSSVTFGMGTTGAGGYNIANSASGATINVDRVTGTGTNTITVGNLTTTSTAATWQLNFTGANGVSLSAGALTAPLSTLTGTHAISNNIATTNGAALTLASVHAASTFATPVLNFTGAGNTIVTGNITQATAALALTKNGTGKVTLNGSAGYTGTTTVTGGILAVNGSLGNTSTTVQTGATLQGSGTIGGSVTVQSGGTLASGNSIESLATGSLSLLAGSTFAQEIDDAFAGGNTSGDLTAVTGTLNLAVTNNTILNLFEVGASGGWGAGDKITLIGYSTGTWNNGLFTYLSNVLNDDTNFTFSGVDWTFNYNDTAAGDNYQTDMTAFTGAARYVTMTAVPEPNVAALIGALGGILLLRRRR